MSLLLLFRLHRTSFWRILLKGGLSCPWLPASSDHRV